MRATALMLQRDLSLSVGEREIPEPGPGEVVVDVDWAGICAAFVGRPYLWGLTAAGEPGVDRVAQLLIEQLRRTMQLLGVASVDELRKRGAELVAAAH
ncbi:alpha-hydroxy-acid oxidizing protein [Nocardia macrotermitis]|uniref:FMN-dependent dehydrogenase domain-containing protein n=1 Tax=Nocardia macrotermitis TaxID=2585198 RepID=A0A7K0DFI9_9NOCA|nr:alpha-hydroxy-acid oxidizing protein [Nocardia macrotermitis]MQY23604.1 hypothetical protein [Nocardia macrotermitis]